MFRRIIRKPLAALVLELIIKKFSGYTSIVGDTNSGYVMIDLDFSNGKVVKCRLRFENSEGNCPKQIINLQCEACFAEIEEGTPKHIISDEVIELPHDLRLHESFEDFSKSLSSSNNILEIRKSSRAISVLTQPAENLLKGLNFIAGQQPVILSLQGETYKAIALSLEHSLKALCMWEDKETRCGMEALKEIVSFDDAVPGIYSVINVDALPKEVRLALGIN